MIENAFTASGKILAATIEHLKEQLQATDDHLKDLHVRRDALAELIEHTQQEAVIIRTAPGDGKLSLNDGEKMPSIVRPKVATVNGGEQPRNLDETNKVREDNHGDEIEERISSILSTGISAPRSARSA